jgi:hypothetical protein
VKATRDVRQPSAAHPAGRVRHAAVWEAWGDVAKYLALTNPVTGLRWRYADREADSRAFAEAAREFGRAFIAAYGVGCAHTPTRTRRAARAHLCAPTRA